MARTKGITERDREDSANLPGCSLRKILYLHTEGRAPRTRWAWTIRSRILARPGAASELNGQTVAFEVAAICDGGVSVSMGVLLCFFKKVSL